MAFDDIPEDRCENPCPAEHACPECGAYWQRMVIEGLWDAGQMCWTARAIKEACK